MNRGEQKWKLEFGEVAGGGWGACSHKGDTISNGVATATVPEVSFSVAGPAIAPISGADSSEPAWRDLMVGISGLIVLLLIGWRILRRLRARARQVAAKRRESESFAFLQFAKACRSGDARRAHHLMLAWLNRIGWPGNTRAFAREFGDQYLLSAIDALSDHVYHDAGASVDLAALLTGLKHARQAWRTENRSGSLSPLPPLNP